MCSSGGIRSATFARRETVELGSSPVKGVSSFFTSGSVSIVSIEDQLPSPRELFLTSQGKRGMLRERMRETRATFCDDNAFSVDVCELAFWCIFHI